LPRAERQLANGGAKSDGLHRHAIAKPVYRNVPGESGAGAGIWFDRHHPGATHTGSEHGVAADVRSDIGEEIIWLEQVEYERHLREIVQAAVNVPVAPCMPRRTARRVPAIQGTLTSERRRLSICQRAKRAKAASLRFRVSGCEAMKRTDLTNA
jgi:hypothetical protein